MSSAGMWRPRQSAPGLEEHYQPRVSWSYAALAGMAIFALALALRLIGVERDVTVDEPALLGFSSRFAVGVSTGRFSLTYAEGHPGVPTMWLSALAVGPARAPELATRRDKEREAIVKRPDFLPALFAAKRAAALASAAATVLEAFLVWRLFGPGPGFLAGLLLAGEPYLAAQGRQIHEDPLLAQFMAISVLAALVYFGNRPRAGWSYLIGSGVAAGMALLTKQPAILLFGFVPLVGLVGCWPCAWRPSLPELRRLLLRLAIWGATAASIYFLLWPALWADPIGTIRQMVEDAGGRSRMVDSGSLYEVHKTHFFFGQLVADPGPLYYPVSTLLRLSPITLVGLLLLVVLASRAGRRSTWWSSTTGLLGFVALFALMMTPLPLKKVRYMLPIYPPLVILAALGLHLAFERWLPAASTGLGEGPGSPGQHPRPVFGTRSRQLAVLALGLGQAVMVLSVQPYLETFFNPLLGGSAVARQVIEVGTGEGIDQVAAYLARQPDAARMIVAAPFNQWLSAQIPGTALMLPEWRKADFLVDHVDVDQRGGLAAPVQAMVDSQPPLFTVQINGLDYARVYRIPAELKAR